MKTVYIRRAAIVAATAMAVLTAGCASVIVGNDAIEKKTAFALNIEKGTFTIYDREDSGVESTYKVKTASGKKYNCYVTGGFSYLGTVVSDPECRQTGIQSKQAGAENGRSCNALLKAAGKC